MGVEWRRGRWYLRYKDVSGKWRYKATSYDKPTSAHRQAAQKLFYALEREVMEPARLGLAPAPVSTSVPTVAEAAEWWLRTVSVSTRSHARNVAAVRRHITRAPFAGRPVSSLTRGDVNEWLATKEAAGLAPQTVNHLRAHLSRIYSALDEAGKWEGNNPALRARRRRVNSRISEVLRGTEAECLLRTTLESKAVRTRRRGRLYASALYTGMRASELHRLAIDDVDLADKIIYVRAPKSGRDRIVPIHSELWPLLLEAIDEAQQRGSRWVFPGREGGPLCADSSHARQLRKDLDACGVTRRVTFHDLRRTWATRCAECGVSTRVRRAIGWTGPTGSVDEDVYTLMDPDHLRAEIEKLHYPAEGNRK